MNIPLPVNEESRLRALHEYAILDTTPEAAFERITRLAAQLFHVPIALVSLVDRERQWFKSCYGLDVRQTDREVSEVAQSAPLLAAGMNGLEEGTDSMSVSSSEVLEVGGGSMPPSTSCRGR